MNSLRHLPLIILAAVTCQVAPASAQTASDPALLQIDAKRRELDLKQVMERGRLLKELHRTATANADLAAVNAIQIEIDAAMRRYMQLQNPQAPAPAATAEAPDFRKQLQGRTWKGAGNSTDFDLSFDGNDVIFKYTDGKTFKYTTEVIWPGLLRYKHPSGQISHLAFDDKGETGFFMMYTSDFPGTLMTSNPD